ncbi:hypothetical protein TH53_18410 [Pedobacter lusitanus]|uniref:DUF4249 domain-containing protein n=1 Tax=Pedobacter lusitanus TaxID=1503925 RepID=A0A0D0GIH3_9SPHI|nr:DUF4249 family protein [Pedobacter lusitanus]KIO75860.1 hypothetical protein TH53_18410 [Pedobacter lusitanus]
MDLYSKKYFLIFFLLLTLSSCEKETNVDISGKPPKLVVLGEFNQEDEATINLSTSAYSVAKGGFPDVEDAQVNLYDQNNSLIEKYTYKGKGNYTGKKAVTGLGYKLTVNYQGKAYNAETIIPTAFNLNIKSRDSNSLEAEITDISRDINLYTFELIERPFTVDRYYLENGQKIKVNSEAEFTALLKLNPALEAKRDTTFDSRFNRIYIGTTDSRTENVRYNVLNSETKRIFLTDKTFNGGTTTLVISFAENALNQENKQYVLLAKSTSAVYFDYLYSMDLQEERAISGSLNVPIKGNIDNALGIWGAAYIRKITIK